MLRFLPPHPPRKRSALARMGVGKFRLLRFGDGGNEFSFERRPLGLRERFKGANRSTKRVSELTFRELGCTAGFFEAVFFTFFHTRVTGEVAGFFEFGTGGWNFGGKGAGDSVADCASLTG